MHGGRPYTAWWLRYPGRESSAIDLLRQYRPAVEREIERCEQRWPTGGVDWATVLWDAAYRAAWRCDGPPFWPLLKQSLIWKRRVSLATIARRAKRLRQVDADLELFTFRPLLRRP